MREKELKRKFREERKKMLKQLKYDQKVELLKRRISDGHREDISFADVFDEVLMWFTLILMVAAIALIIFAFAVIVYKLTH